MPTSLAALIAYINQYIFANNRGAITGPILAMVLVSIATYFGTYYANLSGPNTFTGSNTHSGNETFTGTVTLPNLTGLLVGNGTSAATGINPGIFAVAQPGSDACAKITNAIAALPATGGTVNALGLNGTQSCAGGLAIGTATKPVQLVLDYVAITSTGPWVLACHSSLIGAGKSVLGTTVIFSGISSTTDNFTEQFCADTNQQEGFHVSGITLNANGTGQDGARIQGGRDWSFDANVYNAVRDGLVIGGAADAEWTEGALVGGFVLNSGRHGMRFDTTAGISGGTTQPNSTFINHLTTLNLHIQTAATGNIVRVETGTQSASLNNGVNSLNMINFQGLQTGASALPDGIYLNGTQPDTSWQFLGGEVESTVPSQTTGYQYNSSTVQPTPWVQGIYVDSRFGGGQFGPNVTTYLLSQYTGPGGAIWSVSAGSVAGYFYNVSNYGANSVYQIGHTTAATSGSNYSSPYFQLYGSSWTGSASQREGWNAQASVGSGSYPVDTLMFTHFGGGTSQLGINGSVGFSGTKVAGSCTFVLTGGLVTNVTGC